jgi:uncharacterized protein YjiS (DUF1127 family)
MSAYQQRYYSTAVMFQMAEFMHAAASRIRSAAKSLHASLEKRRRAAIAFHEFERMSDRSLRDIGLHRADVLRAAWGVERSGDPLEAVR